MQKRLPSSSTGHSFRSRLREEFRSFPYRLARGTVRAIDHVVVLSGRVVTSSAGVTSWESENMGRIRSAVRLHKEVANSRAPQRRTPLLFLVGTTEQLQEMQNMALRFGAKKRVLRPLACGPIGKANTKTQMLVIRREPLLASSTSLALVTSWFHVPRVVRTADRLLPTRVHFIVAGCGMATTIPEALIRDEIARIHRYAKQGDLHLLPHRTGRTLQTPAERPLRQPRRGKKNDNRM